jgi:hypothetical protein
MKMPPGVFPSVALRLRSGSRERMVIDGVEIKTLTSYQISRPSRVEPIAVTITFLVDQVHRIADDET